MEEGEEEEKVGMNDGLLNFNVNYCVINNLFISLFSLSSLQSKRMKSGLFEFINN